VPKGFAGIPIHFDKRGYEFVWRRIFSGYLQNDLWRKFRLLFELEVSVAGVEFSSNLGAGFAILEGGRFSEPRRAV